MNGTTLPPAPTNKFSTPEMLPQAYKVEKGGVMTRDQIRKRVVCSEAAELFPLGDTGITLRYSCLSQRGYYPESPKKANQDSFKIIPNFDDCADQIYFGVYDGHGTDGDKCSRYVRDQVEAELKRQMAKHPNDFKMAYCDTYLRINNMMRFTDFDDLMAGTTVISAFFKGANFTIANIGDSRAILGQRKGDKIVPISLSSDQTPYRKDERERCKESGAIVMSTDQLEGLEPIHENWGINLGEEIDQDGDPPRLWMKSPLGKPEVATP